MGPENGLKPIGIIFEAYGPVWTPVRPVITCRIAGACPSGARAQWNLDSPIGLGGA